MIDGASGIGVDGKTAVCVAEVEGDLGDGITDLLRERDGDGGGAQARGDDDFADTVGGSCAGIAGIAGLGVKAGAIWCIEGIDEAQAVGGSGGAKGDQEGGTTTG